MNFWESLNSKPQKYIFWAGIVFGCVFFGSIILWSTNFQQPEKGVCNVSFYKKVQYYECGYFYCNSKYQVVYYVQFTSSDSTFTTDGIIKNTLYL